MEHPTGYRWEQLPEYIATMQYSRCLGRIFAELPWLVRRRVVRPLTGAAIAIGAGIVGLNAELPPSERFSADQREGYRKVALDAVALSRDGVQGLAGRLRAPRADIITALELLERIEASVREAEPPPDWL